MLNKALLLVCCSVLPFNLVFADTTSEDVDKEAAAAMTNEQVEETGHDAVVEQLQDIDNAAAPAAGVERYEQFEKSLKKANTD